MLLVLAKLTSVTVVRVETGLRGRVTIWEMSVQMSVLVPHCFICLFWSTFLTPWELFSDCNWTAGLKVGLGDSFPWLSVSFVLTNWTSCGAAKSKSIWGCSSLFEDVVFVLTSSLVVGGSFLTSLLEEMLYHVAGHYELFSDYGCPLNWHLLWVLDLSSCHK